MQPKRPTETVVEESGKSYGEERRDAERGEEPTREDIEHGKTSLDDQDDEGVVEPHAPQHRDWEHHPDDVEPDEP
jgi:hypothetical protein